jgi:hypothetical protein
MVETDGADQLLVNVDAEAIDVGQIVELVAHHFLAVDRYELLAPIRLVAEAVDGIELIFHTDPAIFHPVHEVYQRGGEVRRRPTITRHSLTHRNTRQ